MSAADTACPGAVAAHEVHPYHAANRDWPESNCYMDIWIEILHGASLEVAAMLPFTIACDFEGDQWSFYKPPHSDLSVLYGIEVIELTLWKPVVEHCRLQVERGRIPLVEADAYYLPDTQGRDYRKTHTKTTIGIQAIDPGRETLRYFHNRALFDLSGDDYRGLFSREPTDDHALPPFCEVIKMDRVVRRSPEALRAISLDLLRTHRGRVPRENPIAAHARSVDADLEALIRADEVAYDHYAFAGIRQCGSGFGFTADFLRWLADGDPIWQAASEPFARISTLSSLLVMKMARIVHSGRLRDLGTTFGEMAEAWDEGMAAIDGGLAG